MSIVIIGSGFAGYTIARQIREYDTKVSLTIITQDDGNFYSKPALSRAFTDQKTADTLVLKKAYDLASELNATIITKTTVEKIDPKNQVVFFDENHKTLSVKPKSLQYSQLVLACGANVRPLSLKDNNEATIYHVNNLEQYRSFRNQIEGKKHVALIGSGLIGCEFANDLHNAGYKVSIISIDSWPIPRLLPQKIGKELQSAFIAKGIDFYLNNPIKSIKQQDSSCSLLLENDTEINADVVLSAVGIEPNIKLAKEASIDTDYGIVTNQYLQTNFANIFAIGDCAEVCGLSHQYVAPIRHCSRALAQTLTGNKTKVHYPAMAIGIKIPIYPTVVCKPIGDQDNWQINIDHDGNVEALHFDQENQLNGFILTKNNVKRRLKLESSLVPWLAS